MIIFYTFMDFIQYQIHTSYTQHFSPLILKRNTSLYYVQLSPSVKRQEFGIQKSFLYIFQGKISKGKYSFIRGNKLTVAWHDGTTGSLSCSNNNNKELRIIMAFKKINDKLLKIPNTCDETIAVLLSVLYTQSTLY